MLARNTLTQTASAILPTNSTFAPVHRSFAALALSSSDAEPKLAVLVISEAFRFWPTKLVGQVGTRSPAALSESQH